ncbi:homoserine O-acetyltransferase MetX [Mycetocola saprophilus]|uniref:homoserine O-acetyltransferase MetX n=1 Tax=Mycetocola saprophilus TaxID=76636 RepID=UPI003BF0E312
MDWQTPEESVPSSMITEDLARALMGKPPATGAWRDGDKPGNRQFAGLGAFEPERGGRLPFVRIAFETFGELSPERDNAILIIHAFTGDSHVRGEAGPGHYTAGWWSELVGPGLAIDTDRYHVVVPNILGGCQGSTGPASFAPDGREWGERFPYLTVRDQVRAQALLADHLGIDRWNAVIGGSMGGMHAIEWGVTHPERVARLAVLAAPAAISADQIGSNLTQLQAITMDPGWAQGRYYDADDGEGPHAGLALARRIAMLSYRAPDELNARFDRIWQSSISPLGDGGRFALESYLDFHGNKFTRRFDANSYLTLLQAMNSHDVGRDRGGVEAALARVTAPTLVLGIDSDRLFPVETQHRIAAGVPRALDGDTATVINSIYGHDGFLIEFPAVGAAITRLLSTEP